MVKHCTVMTKSATEMTFKECKLHLQIRTKRRELDMKQEVLARESDLSISYICKLERGCFGNMTLQTLEKISKALDYYAWDLGFMTFQF